MKRISILTSLLLISACNSPIQQVVKDVIASSSPSTASSVKPSVVGSSIVSANPSANIQQGEGGQTAIKPTPIPVEENSSSSGSIPEPVRTPPPEFGPTPPIVIIGHADDLRVPSPKPQEIGNRDLSNVPDYIKNGNIRIIFRDEYKVRYDKIKKEFFSHTGEDLSNINKLLLEYKAEEPWWNDISEQKALEQEIYSESPYEDYDFPNSLSVYMYNLKVQDLEEIEVKKIVIEAKELISKIRLDKVVRTCDLSFNALPG